MGGSDPRRPHQGGMTMTLSRRTFLSLATGAAALPAASRLALAQAYPARAGASPRRVFRRQRLRHHRPPGRAKIIRATRPAGRGREPAGRRHQHCRRSGHARAGRRLYASARDLDQCGQHHALSAPELQFLHRYRAGRLDRSGALRARSHAVAAGQDAARIHRLCQSQSGQDQHGVERHRLRARMSPANCSR